jgi:hypothetical protein
MVEYGWDGWCDEISSWDAMWRADAMAFAIVTVMARAAGE